MKHKAILALITVSLSSSFCGVQAQDLAGIISKAKSAASAMTGKNTGNISGTWVYESSAINFTSDNILARAGGKLVSSKLESRINSALKKHGLTPDNLTLKLAADSTYTCSFKAGAGKETKGKYALQGNRLTFIPSHSKKEISVNAKTGSKLELTCNADRLMTLIQGLSTLKTENATIKAIAELAKNYSGMQVGLTFKKK